MRTQLDADLKSNLNLDAAKTIKDLLEKHNALAAQVEALLALLESDKADITSTDFAAESEDNKVSID